MEGHEKNRKASYILKSEVLLVDAGTSIFKRYNIISTVYTHSFDHARLEYICRHSLSDVGRLPKFNIAVGQTGSGNTF